MIADLVDLVNEKQLTFLKLIIFILNLYVKTIKSLTNLLKRDRS